MFLSYRLTFTAILTADCFYALLLVCLVVTFSQLERSIKSILLKLQLLQTLPTETLFTVSILYSFYLLFDLIEMKRSVESNKRPSRSQTKINILDIKVRWIFRHSPPFVETNLCPSIYYFFFANFTSLVVVINGFETRGVNFDKFAFMRLKSITKTETTWSDISCLTTLRSQRPTFHFRPLFTKMIN